MNKFIFVVVIIISSFMDTMSGQDIINQYKLVNQMNDFQTEYAYPPASGYFASNPNNTIFTPWARQEYMTSAYNGEYMILIDQHPWFRDLSLNSKAKSFKVEVVSFPFTIPCWDLPDGCGYPCYGSLDARNLLMPDALFDPTTSKWGNLCREFIGEFEQPAYKFSNAGLLVSQRFTR